WGAALRGRAAWCGVLAGLGALTKYAGLLNLPLSVLALSRAGWRKAAVSAALGFGLFLAWCAWTGSAYGQAHVASAGRFQVFALRRQTEFFLSFVASLGLAGLPAAVGLIRWTGRTALLAAAAGAGGAALVHTRGAGPWNVGLAGLEPAGPAPPFRAGLLLELRGVRRPPRVLRRRAVPPPSPSSSGVAPGAVGGSGPGHAALRLRRGCRRGPGAARPVGRRGVRQRLADRGRAPAAGGPAFRDGTLGLPVVRGPPGLRATHLARRPSRRRRGGGGRRDPRRRALARAVRRARDARYAGGGLALAPGHGCAGAGRPLQQRLGTAALRRPALGHGAGAPLHARALGPGRLGRSAVVSRLPRPRERRGPQRAARRVVGRRRLRGRRPPHELRLGHGPRVRPAASAPARRTKAAAAAGARPRRAGLAPRGRRRVRIRDR